MFCLLAAERLRRFKGLLLRLLKRPGKINAGFNGSVIAIYLQSKLQRRIQTNVR